MIKKSTYLISAVLIAGVMSGCKQEPTPQLKEAQAFYETTKNDTKVEENAPIALYEAKKTLKKAQMAEDMKNMNHLAYLAKKKVEIAKEIAERKEALKKIEELKQIKNRVILEAREAEINRAKKEIENKTKLLKSTEEKMRQEQARIKAEQEKAKRLQQELAELHAKQTKRGLVLTLGDVLFETNKADLLPGAMRSIDKLARFLEDNPNRKVLIEGHTDSRGSDAYNLKLSQKRADAVRQALISRGILSNRIIAKGYGEKYPVASNLISAGRQQNRRVEIVILDEGVNPKSMMRKQSN